MREINMQEIKYRGKRVDNDEWVYGYPCLTRHLSLNPTHEDKEQIELTRKCEQLNGRSWFYAIQDSENPMSIHEVIPGTVGQFTGEHEMLGHKGKEIYKDDVVEIKAIGLNYENKTIRGVVKFVDGCFEVEFSEPIYDMSLKTYRQRLYVKCFIVNNHIKVIGNTHEPELLPV